MLRRKAVLLALLCTPVLLQAQSPAAQFDGNWVTTVACDASTHMPAYNWRFLSVIKDSVYHGQHGEEGGPGYMVVDGTINADGTAKLHAKGTVQPGKAGMITELKGNKYDYYIEAKFTETSGTGSRDEGAGILGRPCAFKFTKQTDTAAPPPPPQ